MRSKEEEVEVELLPLACLLYICVRMRAQYAYVRTHAGKEHGESQLLKEVSNYKKRRELPNWVMLIPNARRGK